MNIFCTIDITKRWDFVFLTVTEMISLYFLRDQNHIFDIQYSVTESRATVGQDWSGPEFHVNFGSGRVGSF